MQRAVTWWCNLIGVTDLSAIQTATGIIAAAMAILAFLWVFNTVFWLLGANVSPIGRREHSK